MQRGAEHSTSLAWRRTRRLREDSGRFAAALEEAGDGKSGAEDRENWASAAARVAQVLVPGDDGRKLSCRWVRVVCPADRKFFGGGKMTLPGSKNGSPGGGLKAKQNIMNRTVTVDHPIGACRWPPVGWPPELTTQANQS